MRYQFIAAEKANHSIALMCRVLEVSRSGYYDWWRRGRIDLTRSMQQEAVKQLHRTKRGRLGSRRMARELRKLGHDVGRYRARTLMREAGVECRQRRRYKVTTDSRDGQWIAPNRLQRDFDVDTPNTAWVADITAVWTFGGWVYLAAVLDLHDRQIVGWSAAGHMRVELTLDALRMAIGRRRPAAGLIHHSDRGSQYASTAYRHALSAAGMVASMSRKGDCWDNAVMERFFGTLKTEWTDARRYRTRTEAIDDIAHFIEWEYNAARGHTSLDDLTPMEKELATAA